MTPNLKNDKMMTGTYVVRAEDLPPASKLPCAAANQARKIWKIYCKNKQLRMLRHGEVVAPSAQILQENISSARRKQTFQSGSEASCETRCNE